MVLAAVLLLALSSATAWADGDPASDVLAAQPVFLAQDAAIPVRQQAELTALVQEAARAGRPVRVAIIASPTDLGSITELWGQPAAYARFLAQELALVYRGQLLVVMPNGYGVARVAGARTAGEAAPPGLPAPGPAGLGGGSLRAVERLAAASGVSLALPRVSGAAGSGRGAGDPMAWLAFGVGLVLVVAAWVASARARPLQLPRRAG